MSQLPWADGALLLLTVVVILGGIWALRRAGARRQEATLPPGQVVYADTGDWRPTEAPLFSDTYGLTGKPDYLVETRHTLIPVEVKSGATPNQPYRSHVLQLGAYCLLTEENYGVKVPYGLVRYPQAVFKVEFTGELRRTLIHTLQRMRADLEKEGENAVSRSHENPGRCAKCGYRQVCNQRLS